MTKNRTSITAINKISVFAKTEPKVTKVEGGYLFDFTDVTMISQQQEISGKNFNLEGFLKKFFGQGITKGDSK